MRDCIILGAGRSGTSMLAGVLHSSDYFMGDTLLEATSANPKGYFESREVNELNDELIASVTAVRPAGPLGYVRPWRLPRGLLWLASVDPGVEIGASSLQLERMRQLTSRKPFCLKDPRFCYTLDAWRPVLGDAVFLCIFREPGRTAISMRKNLRERPYRGFHLTMARALRAWTSMYEYVLRHRRHEARWLFVHYDQVLDGSATARIEDAIEAKLDFGFVDRDLKRSHDSGHLPQRTMRVYEQLCELAEAG